MTLWPERFSTDDEDLKAILDYASRQGFTQLIIIGFNERDEYQSESYGATETDRRCAGERRAVVTDALRKAGLTINIYPERDR